MLPEFIDKSKIPHKSGVYIFKDNKNNVLYVGKAVDLYSRVSSYFNSASHPAKTAVLVENIREIETIIVESELEALILEANLIKRHLPPFNIRLTDDKDYLYIIVTKEDYPQIITARKKDLKRSIKYFGPFPSSRTVKDTLKKLRRVFPWCAAPRKDRLRGNRPCFYYHLGLCPGACVGKISKEEYRKIISMFIKFMDGKKQEIAEELILEMGKASKDLEFEEAERVKRILAGINYITQTNQVKSYLENPNFLESQREDSLRELMKYLGLEKIPERIECFDISNLQGGNATGSMVVLVQGEIDKSQYRRFKIKISGKINDVGMHKEMFLRRIKHKGWPTPDLILVDGGKGQIGVYREILENIGFKIPVFGLAKREEWIYGINGEVIKLPKKSLGLRLLQKIRDEAHRFAINYHKKLRTKEFINV